MIDIMDWNPSRMKKKNEKDQDLRIEESSKEDCSAAGSIGLRWSSDSLALWVTKEQ